MFCYKCGTQIAEGADFCHKCGAKVVSGKESDENSFQEENVSTARAKPEPIMPGVPVQAALSDGFKEFVDNHVRTTTKFQSAEELLKNSKPQMYLWFCFGIPVIIGFMMGGPLGALVFGLFFGHVARLIAGGIIRNKYIAETIGTFDGSIDASDLLQFLNVHLSYLHPYFHEGKCNAGVLSFPFGEKQKSTVLIHIMPDKDSPDSERWKYVFDAQNNPSMLSRIVGLTVFSLIQIHEPKHTCLFKAIPILQAAMEYYLKEHRGEDDNVLS